MKRIEYRLIADRKGHKHVVLCPPTEDREFAEACQDEFDHDIYTNFRVEKRVITETPWAALERSSE